VPGPALWLGSPSGRTLGSAVCGDGRCNIELIDRSAASVVRELDGLSDGLWFVTDATLITVALGRFGALDRVGHRSGRWMRRWPAPATQAGHRRFVAASQAECALFRYWAAAIARV
jgi:hypothetical protein